MKITLPDSTKLFFDIYGAEQVIYNNKLIKKPTIIFLHGGPGLADHNLYVQFWSRFQNIAQVIFLDFRGHGQSDGWDQEDKFNLHSWAQDVKDFCVQLGIENPIIVGFSFGGWVALEYAINYPDHPGALILCNTEAHIDVALRAEMYAAKAKRLPERGINPDEIRDTVLKLGNGTIDSKETAKIYIEKCVPLFSEKPGAPEEELVWTLCKQNPLAWKIFDRNEQFNFDYRPKLHQIKAPVLSISGELDVEHPASSAAEMCKLIGANARQVILKNTGDPVDHDDPEGTTKTIEAFIRELCPNVRQLF